MKTLILSSLFFLASAGISLQAQDNVVLAEKPAYEKYGKTLNLGAGIGYYGYVGSTLPVGTLNFEFDVARHFTLAPFVGIYSYQRSYYWGNPNKEGSYRYYSYRETAVPLGVKGTYYFDKLFHANAKWDFYASGSVGFVLRSVTWENGYYGDRYAYRGGSPLYLDAHIGAEYHMTQKAGIFLDLSTGVSTFGFAFHF
ncbi:MAG: hypothetical protein IPJ32_13435 [Sphingobacteriaceae bacterium]|nr:hypothetical protein [Sphingobacteriaceae bacterium]